MTFTRSLTNRKNKVKEILIDSVPMTANSSYGARYLDYLRSMTWVEQEMHGSTSRTFCFFILYQVAMIARGEEKVAGDAGTIRADAGAETVGSRLTVETVEVARLRLALQRTSAGGWA